MNKILNVNDRIGFMQGRLCDQVDGKIQAFPWNEWEKEFSESLNLDFRLMEWTLDQNKLYENPIMTNEGRKKILQLCDKCNLSIPSLTGDCFMQDPFWKAEASHSKKLKDDFVEICNSCAAIGIRMLVIPLVDNGRINNDRQKVEILEFLLSKKNFLRELNLQVIFESDQSPRKLKEFISELPLNTFGINYDIGNSAALDFNPLEEFKEYGDRIVNVHVKDRLKHGTTVPLETGNAKFEIVFSELAKLGYEGNYILQTARANDGNHSALLKNYKQLVYNWINPPRKFVNLWS